MEWPGSVTQQPPDIREPGLIQPEVKSMKAKLACEIPKNSRETYRFRLGEYKGRRFVDLRLYVQENGQDPVPTKKGLTVPPHPWPRFRRALAQVDEALGAAGWLDWEDLAQD